jgi:hypothetical protein
MAILFKTLLPLICLAVSLLSSDSFSPASFGLSRSTKASSSAVFMSDDFSSDDMTQERIGALVEGNPVLLFMKGNKLFPQCGFSNTAIQILTSFGIEFVSEKRVCQVSQVVTVGIDHLSFTSSNSHILSLCCLRFHYCICTAAHY